MAIFMKALQDDGVINKKSKGGTLLKLNKIDKLAATLYKDWSKLEFTNLPNNPSQTKETIVNIILKLWKHVDCTAVYESLRDFATTGSEEVYIITNNEEHAGFDIVLRILGDYWERTTTQKKNNWIAEDGIRCAAILLDPNRRGSVARIVLGKKDRYKQDQAFDTTDAFFQTVLDDSNNPLFHVTKPDGVQHIPNGETIDPNCILEGQDCDAIWMRTTWTDYVRPKYCKVLKKWYKDTCNGSKLDENFPNYCEENSQWLLWVYLLDHQQDFLLASTSAGKVPAFMARESDFDNEEGLKEGLLPAIPNSNRKRRDQFDGVVARVTTDHAKAATLIETAATFLPAKQQKKGENSTSNNSTSKFDQLLLDFQKSGEHHERVSDASDISPGSKEIMLIKIKRCRVQISRAIKVLPMHEDSKE